MAHIATPLGRGFPRYAKRFFWNPRWRGGPVPGAVGLAALLGGLALGSANAGRVAAAAVSSPFVYAFDEAAAIEEVGSMEESSSPYFWLNSGGRLLLGGVGSTLRGSLPSRDRWRRAYAADNAQDTDDGYHPQNLFRLITRSQWGCFRQQVRVRVVADQPSSSPNRNASNGLLLMSRYQSGATLYYTGLRVDGAAVIKKKKDGKYTTLASGRVLEGRYDRASSPNLIPKHAWLGLRAAVCNNADGSVSVRLWLDLSGKGQWSSALEARDDGSLGGAPIDAAGHAGIRTDFMDVEFDDYRAEAMDAP